VADSFGWLGETRRLVLAAKLEQVLAAWWQAWGIGESPVRAAEADRPIADGGSWSLTAGRGSVAVCVEGAAPSLAGVLTGIDDERGLSLADHLTAAALKDLLDRMVQALGVGGRIEAETRDELPAALRKARLGAAHFVYHVGAVHLSICMDRDAIARIAPGRPASTRALTQRTEALHPVSIRLRTTLDLGTITLGELRDLRAGDVIATDTPLTQAFDLQIDESGRHVSQGRLGSQDGRRALLVQASE
jgi:Type III flagellar switch regulator (C-ring) FliN C-term